jgi:hypothetical protein
MSAYGKLDQLWSVLQVSEHFYDKNHWWRRKNLFPKAYKLPPFQDLEIRVICCVAALWKGFDGSTRTDASLALALAALDPVLEGFEGLPFKAPEDVGASLRWSLQITLT